MGEKRYKNKFELNWITGLIWLCFIGARVGATEGAEETGRE